jgi:hypothetical protein
VNHSLYSANRTTYIKVVVVALIAAIAVLGFGIAASMNNKRDARSARIIKASKVMTLTRVSASLVQ